MIAWGAGELRSPRTIAGGVGNPLRVPICSRGEPARSPYGGFGTDSPPRPPRASRALVARRVPSRVWRPFQGSHDRVGEGGLCPPQPERGRVWEPSQGSHFKWRRRRDSNPWRPFEALRFSRPSPSTTRPLLRMRFFFENIQHAATVLALRFVESQELQTTAAGVKAPGKRSPAEAREPGEFRRGYARGQSIQWPGPMKGA